MNIKQLVDDLIEGRTNFTESHAYAYHYGMDHYEQIPPEELEQQDTLSVGQAHDLKHDTGKYRYWLSRCGPEDGETHRVHVEKLSNEGRWSTFDKYGAFGEE